MLELARLNAGLGDDELAHLHHLVPGTSGASLGRQLEGHHPFSSTVPSDLQVIPLASR